jgi:nitroreductase
VSALEAVRNRKSYSKVTAEAPTHAELVSYVEAVSSVADHSGLHPWRLIELRGDARLKLGASFAEATGDRGKATKPLRAELLIAVVASIQPSHKVPAWEQEAVASGVAHLLSLVLDEAGWGVFWRTGEYTRSKEVHKMHKLGKHEYLLGWLYVGGKPGREKSKPRRPFAPITEL